MTQADLSGRTWRVQKGPRAALPLLLVYAVLLFGIPSDLVVAPLGAAGSPAAILGIGLMAWWAGSLLVAPYRKSGSNLIKYLLLAFALSLLLSYLVGMSRPIASQIEISSADRGVLAVAAWCGIALVVIDGLDSRARLNIFLKALAIGATSIAVLGMMQFFFDLDLARIIHVPGLTANGVFGEVISRSAFRRVTGTTSHPIEFGVILAAVLPIGMHFARYSTTPGSRGRWWTAVLLMAGALPLSVARSGVLGAIIALLILYLTWPSKFRRRVLAGIVSGMLLMSLVVPGLLGTIRGLFVNLGSDPSTGGRTDDYAPAFQYFSESPVFGRGFGTFIPALYRTLDNQYLGLLVEAGVVGVGATLALFVGTVAVLAALRRRFVENEDRDLCQTLIAAIAVIAVNAATFDLFGFAMCTGVAFAILGVAGNLREQMAVSSTRVAEARWRLSNRALWAILATSGVVFGGSCFMAERSTPQYQAHGSVILVPPSPKEIPLLATVGRANMAASILVDVLQSAESRSSLAQMGVANFNAAIGDGSLMPGTDRLGTSSALINFVVRSSRGIDADEGLSVVYRQMQRDLDSLQLKVHVPPDERISLNVLSANPAYEVRGRPTRTLLAGGLLTLIAGCVMTHVLRRRGTDPGLGDGIEEGDLRVAKT